MLNLRMLMLYVRYEEKRWVPRDGKAKSPSRGSGEGTSIYRPEPRSSGHGRMNGTNHGSEERRITRPPVTNDSSPASRSSTPAPIKASTPLPVKASTPMPVKASQPVDTFLLPLAFFSHATFHFPSPFQYHFNLSIYITKQRKIIIHKCQSIYSVHIFCYACPYC